MFDAILVPTDGSDHALRAAERAAELARACGADLRLLTVVDLEAAAGPFDAGGVDDETKAQLRDDGWETVRATGDAIGNPPGLETDVVTGYPPDAILEYASEHDVDLVAMGTRGLAGVTRRLLGSVAERVVRNADVPVLAVGEWAETSPGEGYGEVLIPTDGSDQSMAVVEPALALAGAFDARVHAVNVVDAGGVPALSPSDDLVERFRSEGEAATDAVAERARDAGLDAVTEVRSGRPAKQLLAYAGDNDVDLIAMGTTGRSGLGERLLGSRTERVLRHADVPVLAVGASDAGQSSDAGAEGE